MELTWYGLGCFRIAERGYPAIVIDPFVEEETGLSLPKGRADIVISSVLMDAPEEVHWKGLRGVTHTLAGPGEYEIGGVFVTGIMTFRDCKRGMELGQNIVYSINVNGVVICHLGELGSTPTQAQIEAMGEVNVLLVPVGIPNELNPMLASEVVSLIEPDIVVPMHYTTPGLLSERGTVSRFLKEMGVAESNALPSLKVSSGGESEETQVILMEPQIS